MPLHYITFIILILFCEFYNEDVTDGTELVFAFMVHRHGDRTPIAASLSATSSVTDELLDLIKPWGYGELTNEGRRTGYKTGEFIRRRYNELLSPVYNKSEIYIRSTDSTRAKMTVLTAMAAVYPPVGETWSQDINWVPVPYTTVPAKYDFNTAMINCPVLVNATISTLKSPSARLTHYNGLLSDLTNLTGASWNYSNFQAMSYVLYDTLISKKNLGYDLGNDVESIMPKLDEAAGEAIDVVYGDDRYIALQAGVFLNEFFKYATKIRNGTDTQRVRVYSAHDFNVYSLEAVSRVWPRQGLPKYGSVFSLELRRVTATGEYVVLPLYLATPSSKEIFLQVEGCNLLCNVDQFYNITSKYLRDVDTWRSECGFTEDLVVDYTVGFD